MMSTSRASLLRRTVVTLAASLALVAPMTAHAGLLNGLSIRGGFFRPDSGFIRQNVGDVVWGGGIDYKIARFPSLLNGDQWSTSISVDYHYGAKKSSGVYRAIPACINQVYTFDSEAKVTPFAGFFVGANTFGGTHQATLTRACGGLITGLNFGKSLYVEGRYMWTDDHGVDVSIPGFIGYVGWRF
jgi:hypothetical protein